MNKKNCTEANGPEVICPEIRPLPYRSTDSIPFPDLGVLFNSQKIFGLVNLLQTLLHFSMNTESTISLFSVDRLDIKSEILSGLLLEGGNIYSGELGIPSYIFNTAVHSKASSIKKIRQLRGMDRVKVINPINRFNQSVLLDILKTFANPGSYLLPYSNTNRHTASSLAGKYGSFFLLPEKSIYHPHAIIVEPFENNDSYYTVSVGGNQDQLKRMDLDYYIKQVTRGKTYVAYQNVGMLKWQNKPLEARVYAQKGASGYWSVTALVAKLECFSASSIYAGSCAPLSSVLTELLLENSGKAIAKLIEYTINSCIYLDHYLSDLGNLTFDFILDQSGKPYLMYIGGSEQNEYLYASDITLWCRYIENSALYLDYIRKTKALVPAPEEL